MDPRWNNVVPAAGQGSNGTWNEEWETNMQGPSDQERVAEAGDRHEDGGVGGYAKNGMQGADSRGRERVVEKDEGNKGSGADEEAKGVDAKASSVKGQKR
jgi:hypothetical protein